MLLLLGLTRQTFPMALCIFVSCTVPHNLLTTFQKNSCTLNKVLDLLSCLYEKELDSIINGKVIQKVLGIHLSFVLLVE